MSASQIRAITEVTASIWLLVTDVSVPGVTLAPGVSLTRISALETHARTAAHVRTALITALMSSSASAGRVMKVQGVNLRKTSVGLTLANTAESVTRLSAPTPVNAERATLDLTASTTTTIASDSLAGMVASVWTK